MESISTALVIGLGLGTVFVCLICLVIICYLTSVVAKLFVKDKKEIPQPTQKVQTEITNKGEFAAAIACAIAEDLGCEVSGIRIKSIKKIS